jgi:hypothetical protein
MHVVDAASGTRKMPISPHVDRSQTVVVPHMSRTGVPGTRRGYELELNKSKE